MAAGRKLVVVADDFGIGPGTSRAILELGQRGIVTGTVLLANSPHAQSAIDTWIAAGRPFDMGWHPCLTLDRPLADPRLIPSLVDRSGFFHPLGVFLRKIHLGRVCENEVELEFRAQLDYYRAVVGSWPTLVNSHQHVSLFEPVGRALLRVLSEFPIRPYVRRVMEPWASLFLLPGARLKRSYLAMLGRIQSRKLNKGGYPGAPWMIGLTDPHCLQEDSFFSRWLAYAHGETVELMCHPGHSDPTLVGRDSPPGDLRLFRRLAEFRLLGDPSFDLACKERGFERIRPGQLMAAQLASEVCAHAA
jgi:predicted glycoside hydrolase/deacetylase ChbG (UPF0249 family)